MTDSTTVRGTEVDLRRQLQILTLFDQTHWGRLASAVNLIDETADMAIDVTAEYFMLWEDDARGEARFGDEFSLLPSAVASLTDEWRLAYVARLLESFRLAYGNRTSAAASQLPVRINWNRPGVLLRSLISVASPQNEASNPQLEADQKLFLLEAVERVTLGDFPYYVTDAEDCLRLALEATEQDLAAASRIEVTVEALRSADPDSIAPSRLLAHTAVLLRQLASAYGMSNELWARRAYAASTDPAYPSGVLAGLTAVMLRRPREALNMTGGVAGNLA